jgi:hypothetical protein
VTRFALVALFAGATVAAGCDRVFGLIGEGTPITADARQSDGATPGDARDAAPEQAFCSTRGPQTQYCLDFEEAQPLAGLLPIVANGTLELSEEQARSPLHSMRTEIDFSTVGFGSNPRAYVSHDINTDTTQFGIASTYGFAVYISPAMAGDIAIFEIVTNTTDLTMFASGSFGGTVTSRFGSTTDFGHSLVDAIPRGMWVPIRIVFTYTQGAGAIDVEIGSAAAEEEGLPDSEPMPQATISIGLQQAQVQPNQDNVVVYFDDVFVE